MSRGRLVVFAKAPEAGRVKTRMCPPLSLDQAASLYHCMLEDVLERTAGWVGDTGIEGVVAIHPPDRMSRFLPILPIGLRLEAQVGADLGERMANAFAESAATGVDWTLLRGSDSPGMTTQDLRAAIERLERGDDVVLTPDGGGGYAMIGLRAPCSLLFEIPMSTHEMLEQTLEIARDSGLRTSTLPAVMDLDTADDLLRFESTSREGPSDSGHRTVEAISTLRADGVL